MSYGPKPMNEEMRFMSHVVKGDCWIWHGAKSAKGYGSFKVGSLRTGTRRNELAHRWSYTYHKGLIPAGLEIDHLCRNPSCVKPEHLEAVTGHVNNLRSNSFAGVHARKTHCIRGHVLIGKNLYRHPAGRGCKQCRAMHREASRARAAARATQC